MMQINIVRRAVAEKVTQRVELTIAGSVDAHMPGLRIVRSG